MSQALYRRYRSTSFDGVVGQEHVTKLLDKALKQGAISHAYLFTGPRGVGKTSVARILAHAVNELPYSHTSHLDIIEIDAASNRRIDDVRDLREKVHIAPSSARYKVYIIDEVHMLTGESFNALLKTLEEPPTHAVFILATTEIHKVPATIISRTQRFHFKPGTASSITKHLQSVATAEKIDIQKDALELLADHSEGSFRDALSLLDQIAGGADEPISREYVESLLGVAPHASITAIIKATKDYDTHTAITTLKKLTAGGISPATIAQQLAKGFLHEADSEPRFYELVTPLLDLQRSNAAELRLLAVIGTAAYDDSSATRIKPKNMAAKATKSQPVIVESERPSIPAKKAKSNQNKKATAKDTDTVTASTSKSFTWEEVLEIAQKRAPALYGVLKRAEADCTAERVTLTFQYALHRKKLSDAKYSSQLSGIFVNSFGCSPEIIITDVSQTALSDEANNVAAIMGGGKPVNA